MARPSSQAVAQNEKYPRNPTKEDVDRWMTEISNWGKWGSDHQARTINLITPAKRNAAAALVRDGVSVTGGFSHPNALSRAPLALPGL